MVQGEERIRQAGLKKTMKAILEFSLPDDDGDHKIAVRAKDFYCSILEIRKIIRDHEKYGSPKSAKETLDAVREEAYSVETDDIP